MSSSFICAFLCVLSHVWLFATPWTVAYHGILKARILEWLPFPSPGDRSHPRTDPASLVSPAVAGGFFTTVPPGRPLGSSMVLQVAWFLFAHDWIIFHCYIFIYYIASLVAQTIKSLPAMQETQVWSLSERDPLEKEMATYSSTLAWKNPMDGGAWWPIPHGVAKSLTHAHLSLNLSHIFVIHLTDT